jgi:ABC-type multidrug transport system ATPase subunit
MISTRRLSVVAAERSVISDVSMRVCAGECVGLSGVSGSGRTALLQALAGRVRPTAGTIHLNGDERPSDPYLLRRNVGYAAVEAMVGHGLRVDEYLRFVVQVKASRNERQSSADTAAAQRAGLNPSSAIAGLAPAQHAALAIAAAIVTPVKVVVIDAAIDGLAPADRARLVSWMVEIRDDGVAMLVASNDPAMHNALCHRVITLVRGAVVEELHLSTPPVATGYIAPEVSSP